MVILLVLIAAIVIFAIDATRRVHYNVDGTDAILLVCMGCILFIGLFFQINVLVESMH